MIPKPEPKPTDKPLLWREERDLHGNSTHEALSITFGNEQLEPTYYWRAKCDLLNNVAVWSILESDGAVLLHDYSRAIRKSGTEGIFATAEDAMSHCQAMENEMRAYLGGRVEHPSLPEPETAPLIADDHGFAPTTTVRPRWSRNEGNLRFVRVWKKTDGSMEQERGITDPEEENACIAGYFRQKLIEESVTRLCTGGFGRLLWETPFATAHMQVELDFISVSAITLTIRRAGEAREIPMKPVTTDEIMHVVARQMQARQRALDERIGNVDVRELQQEIIRNARILGLDIAPPPNPTEAGSSILPVTLEDIQAGGGNITDPGQKGL